MVLAVIANIPSHMRFHPAKYGQEVAAILSLKGDGGALPRLTCGPCTDENARMRLEKQDTKKLFPQAKDPDAAMAGLWLYFSCFEEAHKLVDNPHSPERTFWHAIVHRREPDAGNAAYWFRQLGEHPLFKPLATEARDILKRNPTAEFRIGQWDPFAFINFCERAREQPGSVQELVAMEIQRAEWQLLFDYSAVRT